MTKRKWTSQRYQLNSKFLHKTPNFDFSYRLELQEEDFEPYDDLVKQSFSLQNASDIEIYKAKSQRLISM